jgi:hypothetical protein
MSIHSQTPTEQALRKLTRLAKSGQASDSLARNIQKLLGVEINQLEMDMAATQKDMAELSSNIIYPRQIFSGNGRRGKLTTVWITLSGPLWRKWPKTCAKGWTFSEARLRKR